MRKQTLFTLIVFVLLTISGCVDLTQNEKKQTILGTIENKSELNKEMNGEIPKEEVPENGLSDKKEGNSIFSFLKSPVKECTNLCYEDSDAKSSPFLLTRCKQFCKELDDLDKKSLERQIETFKKSISFKKNLEAGVYNKEIEQCNTKRQEAIKILLKFKRYDIPTATEKDVSSSLGPENFCKEGLSPWIEAGKQGNLWDNFGTIIETINKQIQQYEGCYPIMLEYKRLVYTKRMELDKHDIETESKSDCLIELNSGNLDERLKSIQEDLPNWK